jgi:hypothetical protein
MGIKRDKSGKSSSQIVPRIWNSRPSCMVRVASAYLLSEPTIFLGKCLYQVKNVLFFICSVDWKLRWLSFLSVVSRKMVGSDSR